MVILSTPILPTTNMHLEEKLTAILSEPFLLIQIGDYGHAYDAMPLPPGLVKVAEERKRQGKQTYPMNPLLPPPHYHVPADVEGILMNKVDELRLNRFAYWAQALSTRVGPKGCINSTPRQLLSFAKTTVPFWAVLATKKSATNAPKGSRPGVKFKRCTGSNTYICEPPTADINTDIVYTESGKTTLVFDNLEPLPTRVQLDVNQFHVFFTNSCQTEIDLCYSGKRLPYRSSGFGTCSLLAPGKPDEDTSIPLLSSLSALRDIVALASIHPHVCGRVISI